MANKKKKAPDFVHNKNKTWETNKPTTWYGPYGISGPLDHSDVKALYDRRGLLRAGTSNKRTKKYDDDK